MGKDDGRRLERLGWPLAGVAAIGIAGPAWGAGFALKEQSSLAQGSAFAAATAGGDDISYMFFNPAALTLQKHAQGSASLSYIRIETEFSGGEGSTILGTPIGGADAVDKIGGGVALPALYAMAPLGEQVRLGVGITTPFGLSTGYDESWVGRYHAIDSELMTININPVVAIKATEWLSVGLGAQIQYADARLTNAIDFGTIGATLGVPGAVPAGTDGEVKVKGDDWSGGLTAGLLLTPTASTRIGLGYRSEIDHTLTGDADFTADDAGVGQTLTLLTGQFIDTGAQAAVTTPQTVSLGVHQQLGEFALLGEIAWTDWSTLEEVRIQFDNPAQDDNVTEQNWEDSFFYALGLTWDATKALTLRAGVAYDESPVPDAFRTPRVPDSDRYWLSFGAGYEPLPWLSLSASYTHIFVDDGDLDLTTDGVGNAFRGDLSGSYETQIDIVTVSGTLRF